MESPWFRFRWVLGLLLHLPHRHPNIPGLSGPRVVFHPVFQRPLKDKSRPQVSFT